MHWTRERARASEMQTMHEESAGLRRHAANVVTASRVLLAPVFVALVLDGRPACGWIAGLVFAWIAASDVLDGPLARRFGSESPGGRFLDHFADIGFLLTALAAFVWRGELPWWVPASIAAAFTFYVLDSWLRSAPQRPNLIGSRIGHAGGVANYVLVGVLTFNHAAAIDALPAWLLAALFALVPTYSAAAVVARLVGR